MTREIKFRAWDKSDNRMYVEGLPEDFFIHCRGKFCTFPAGDDVLIDDRYFILMQYTGLKDKNGKEIYEGDIVIKYHSDLKKEIGNHHNPFPVEWMKDICGFNIRMLHTHINKSAYIYKVIGNIYENPELLKGVKK